MNHYILFNVTFAQHILYSVYSTVYNVHYTVYNVHYYALHNTLFAIHAWYLYQLMPSLHQYICVNQQLIMQPRFRCFSDCIHFNTVSMVTKGYKAYTHSSLPYVNNTPPYYYIPQYRLLLLQLLFYNNPLFNMLFCHMPLPPYHVPTIPLPYTTIPPS